ncbi:hypothetical protein NMG60_11013218 [Bertholletia excelsa]
MNKTEGSVWRRKGIIMDLAGFRTETTSIATTSATTARTAGGDQNKKKKRKTQVRDKASKRYPLMTFEELPGYMKDNEYILKYYRADWPLKEAFFSLFRWHNETLNIWTHVIGFALFLGLTVANLVHVPQLADLFGIFSRPFPTSSDGNFSHNLISGPAAFIDLKQTTSTTKIASHDMATTRWPFFVFLGGSMFCLLSSSTCHLFGCHSYHLNIMLLRMDYVGITVMIITSFFPPIYYIFQCQPVWQIVYLSGISVMGVFTIITLLSPALTSGKYRAFRALLFVAMGLFGLIPAIHAVVVNWNDPKRNITLAYESAMALFYLIGTVFYVTRVPERWKPGWFDLAGQSHNIFHVFVILGALAHYGAALIFLEYRGKISCERS